MSQRTSFDQQLQAVARLAARYEDPALRDAMAALAIIKQVDQELHTEEPDAEVVSERLVRLFVGS